MSPAVSPGVIADLLHRWSQNPLALLGNTNEKQVILIFIDLVNYIGCRHAGYHMLRRLSAK